MANRQRYTVIVPFPTGGGHWSKAGAELDLLGVEARALVTAGRLKLTATVTAEAAAAAATATAATAKAAKKTTTAGAE